MMVRLSRSAFVYTSRSATKDRALSMGGCCWSPVQFSNTTSYERGRTLVKHLTITTLTILCLLAVAFPISGAPRVRTVLQNSEDRKSTRLNSSHLGISYAVFCLK